MIKLSKYITDFAGLHRFYSTASSVNYLITLRKLEKALESEDDADILALANTALELMDKVLAELPRKGKGIDSIVYLHRLRYVDARRLLFRVVAEHEKSQQTSLFNI